MNTVVAPSEQMDRGRAREGMQRLPEVAEEDPLPVVVPAAQPVGEEAYSDMALMALIGHLVRSYQQGDLGSFIGLFAIQARTSDEASRDQIEAEYRHLFSTTRARSLQVSDLRWRADPVGATGDGYMVLQIRRASGGTTERYEGRFSVNITHERQQLRISGLYYDLDRM